MNQIFKKFIFHPIKRRVAKYYLLILRIFFRIKVIGITGSVGKTTAKEMITSVLSQKYKTVSTLDNIDPVFNIPTTILRATPGTQMLVLEMGVEYPGEMDFYLWLARPDIGVLTNVYWTHTQFLRDLNGVFHEKSKLIRSLSINGLAVLNGDDQRVQSLKTKTQARVILYGLNKIFPVHATDIKITPDLKTSFILAVNREQTEITLPILGRHWVASALAAAAVGYWQNVSLEFIKKGLETFKVAPHRMVPVKTKSGTLILDDAYNSSPLGAQAAIDTLSEVGRGRTTIAFLGDMLELGAFEEEGHMQVGKYVAQKGVDTLVCLGERAVHIAEGAKRAGMKQDKIVIVPDINEGVKFLKSFLTPQNLVVLIKGSRHMHFERVVYLLQGKREKIFCWHCGPVSY